MKTILLLLILIVSSQAGFAQEMITDFLYREGDKSSSPAGFVEFDEKIFFQATTETNGREIWVRKNNETYLLKDINPGKNSGIYSMFSESSVILGSTLYFIATDGSSSGELWKTDGTTVGTEKVTSFLNSYITKLTLVGDNIYFLVKDGDTLQVWISDGSEEGTRIVKENLPIWNTPTFQGKCNTTFIFTFQPFGSNNSRVWRSDGTSTGTFPVTDEIDGNGAGPGGTSALTQYIEFNNELYFVSRYYLHKTDGTLENTVSITSLHDASTRLISYGDVTEVNGKLYFSFFEVDYNRLFIWESDGTESGSNLIYDESGAKYFMTSNLLGKENALIFCGVNNNGGTSLISLNLTDYSINQIKELQETSKKPFIFNIYNRGNLQHIGNNKIFCSIPTDDFRLISWISELTEETTINIETLNNIPSVFNHESSFYFSKNTAMEGAELWKSNGTEDGTLLLENINRSKYGLTDAPLVVLNSNLIFLANDGISGNELWTFDGTNTTLLKDIREGVADSYISSLTKYNDEIYFVANDGVHGYGLWKTNGTSSDTEIFRDAVDGINFSDPGFLTVHKEMLYFVAYIGSHYHLCKTDGANVEVIKDLGENEYGVSLNVLQMLSSGDHLFFVTNAGTLWISDGTESGSYEVKKFSSCENLTDVDGNLFFTASETYYGEAELWMYGTEAEPTLIKDIGSGYSSNPDDLISYNGELFFTAYTLESGRELWKSDGSQNGTVQIIDINSGNQNSFVHANFHLFDNTLYFTAIDGDRGMELWRTDGSKSGTTMVKDINRGNQGSFPSQLVSAKDLFYFQAYDLENGFELWKSDGTEEGTSLASDILSGSSGSSPSNILPINDEVFFIAESIDQGRQIWKLRYNAITSLPKSTDKLEISVFPNPFYDFIYFKSIINDEDISIYSSRGELICTKKADNNSVNISHLPSGLYIIKFSVDGKTVNKKVIKR